MELSFVFAIFEINCSFCSSRAFLLSLLFSFWHFVWICLDLISNWNSVLNKINGFSQILSIYFLLFISFSLLFCHSVLVQWIWKTSHSAYPPMYIEEKTTLKMTTSALLKLSFVLISTWAVNFKSILSLLRVCTRSYSFVHFLHSFCAFSLSFWFQNEGKCIQFFRQLTTTFRTIPFCLFLFLRSHYPCKLQISNALNWHFNSLDRNRFKIYIFCRHQLEIFQSKSLLFRFSVSFSSIIDQLNSRNISILLNKMNLCIFRVAMKSNRNRRNEMNEFKRRQNEWISKSSDFVTPFFAVISSVFSCAKAIMIVRKSNCNWCRALCATEKPFTWWALATNEVSIVFHLIHFSEWILLRRQRASQVWSIKLITMIDTAVSTVTFSRYRSSAFAYFCSWSVFFFPWFFMNA